MKLEDIIKERRSIKRFKDIPVPIDTSNHYWKRRHGHRTIK